MGEHTERERIDMRVPSFLLREVERYQEKNGIATRTAAMMELLRIGLKVASETGQNEC